MEPTKWQNQPLGEIANRSLSKTASVLLLLACAAGCGSCNSDTNSDGRTNDAGSSTGGSGGAGGAKPSTGGSGGAGGTKSSTGGSGGAGGAKSSDGRERRRGRREVLDGRERRCGGRAGRGKCAGGEPAKRRRLRHPGRERHLHGSARGHHGRPGNQPDGRHIRHWIFADCGLHQRFFHLGPGDRKGLCRRGRRPDARQPHRGDRRHGPGVHRRRRPRASDVTERNSGPETSAE